MNISGDYAAKRGAGARRQADFRADIKLELTRRTWTHWVGPGQSNCDSLSFTLKN
jgi:hypothetical protein